jgi:hypothetical protein
MDKAYDADGNELHVGDRIELWTCRDWDGYNVDPALDTREWGYFDQRTIAEIRDDGAMVRVDTGGWWPVDQVRLISED